MKFDQIAITRDHKEGSPGPGMVRYAPSGFAPFRFIREKTGRTPVLWLKGTGGADYAGYFPVQDPHVSGIRRVLVRISVGIPPDHDSLVSFVEKFAQEEKPSQIVHGEIEEQLAEHFRNVDDAARQVDAVFPGRIAFEATLRTRIEGLGFTVLDGPRVAVEPRLEGGHEVIGQMRVEVVPTDTGRRQPVDIVVTLDAPSTADQGSVRELAYLLNQIPARGSSGSVEQAVLATIRQQLDNSYTVQELHHDPGRVASEVGRIANREIGDRFGYAVTLRIVDVPGNTEATGFAGSGGVKASLLGTGREASFQIEYTARSIDDDRLRKAFAVSRAAAATRTRDGETPDTVQQAAATGDQEKWLSALVMAISTTAIKQAIADMPADALPGFGALPEDTSLRLDERANALAAPYFERHGFKARLRIAQVSDPFLRALRNGITVETGLRPYELTQTSTRPQLNFRFDAFLPEGASMVLLTEYFQGAADGDGNMIDMLSEQMTRQCETVVSLSLAQMEPDEFLDTTGNRNVIAGRIELLLEEALNKHFGLHLRPPLVVTVEPDEVQERYQIMRGALGNLTVPLALEYEDGEEVQAVLTLQYQIDRLANPNVGGAEPDCGAVAAWERFRTMALRHETPEKHIGAFEQLMREALRGTLQDIEAERFAKGRLGTLRENITDAFEKAGRQFGLMVRVFPATVIVAAVGGGAIRAGRGIDQAKERLRSLEADQAKDQRELDRISFGGGSEESISIFPGSNDPDDGGSGTDRLRDALERRSKAIKKQLSELRDLRTGARLDGPNDPTEIE